MNNKPRTIAQIDRQHSRSRAGKYTKHNPCECCHKSAGYDYFSISWVNEAPFHGLGLVLCEKCAERLENAGKDEAYRILVASKR